MGRYKKNEWSAKKQKILLLHIEGKTQGEIAKELGMKSQANIGVHMQSVEFQRRKDLMLTGIQEKVRDRFAAKYIRAVDKIIKIMDSGAGKQRLQFDAAKEILYQLGCKPVEVVETRKREYSPQEIQSAMLVMKEMETISNRLEKKKSRFVLDKHVEELPPVPARCLETNSIKTEELKSDVSGEAESNGESPQSASGSRP